MSSCVITGMGIISSLGLSVDEFWQRLLEGEQAVEGVMIPGASVPIWQSRVGPSFNPQDVVDDPRVLRNASRFTFYALAGVSQALAQARLNELPEERTAVLMGTSMGGVPDLTAAQSSYITEGIQKVPARLMASVIPNMAASHIAMHYHLHGPQLTLTSACASGIDSIGMASRLIQSGMADIAIVGGVENLLDPVVSASLFHAHALAQATYSSDASKPFDRDRTGFVMGEGAGVVILESEVHALRREQPILAYVEGYASLADGYHVTAPEPSGKWEARAMERALDAASISAHAIDLVLAHGTGTPVGDLAEIRAIKRVYGSLPAVVTSIKGHIGHSMGASGTMSVIAAIQSMHHSIVPPTKGTHILDPEVDFEIVLDEPLRVPVQMTQVNAFGFGGQNASLVLSREGR